MAAHFENNECGKLTNILTRVLRWVSSDDYQDRGDYILFGKTREEIGSEWFEEFTGRSLDVPQGISSPDERAWLKDWLDAVEKVKRYGTRLRIDRRISLNREAELELSVSERDVLPGLPIERIKEVKSGPESREIIEEHYADELLKKLPKIVKRVSSLDELRPEEIDRDIPSDDVKMYWDEAHRCYLYGFPIACAVLCRAILELALAERMDPDSVIKQQTGRNESYFGRLVEEAGKRNILTDDRPECALGVRDAGNQAIHEYERFNGRSREPHFIAKILGDTRKILIDLYSHKG